MDLRIESAQDSIQGKILAFLQKHSDYTLFLLSNLQEYDIVQTDAAYSGNFKIIRWAEKIVAVFYLCRKGTLLFFTEDEACYSLILEACCREDQDIEFDGIIGEWSQASFLWNYLKTDNWIKEEIFVSKEILYRVLLEGMQVQVQSQPNVRLLSAASSK